MQTITEYPGNSRMRPDATGTGGRKPQPRLLLLSGLLVTLSLSNLVLAESTDEDAVRQSIDELVACLVGTLSTENDRDLGALLNSLSDEELARADEDCTQARVSAYDATEFASYAMGVSVQRKLLNQHETLNWVDFINGLLRAESSTVRASNGQITSVLKQTLLGDAEASQQYLERLAQSEDVEEVSGVYFRQLIRPDYAGDGNSADAGGGPADGTLEGKAPASGWEQAFNRDGVCDDIRQTESSQRLVRFHLVKPINRPIESEGNSNPDVDCIAFKVDDVIRGWRLVIDELELGEIYDVLIPSDLAYGTTGVAGMVESDENLRFLMQVDLR